MELKKFDNFVNENKVIRSTPDYWWSNQFHRINQQLPVEELSFEGVKESLELVGPGKIEKVYDEYQYTDSNFFGYTLFIAGRLERNQGYRYRVAIRGSRGVWVEGEEEIRRYGTNIRTISKLIQSFVDEFIR